MQQDFPWVAHWQALTLPGLVFRKLSESPTLHFFYRETIVEELWSVLTV